MHYVEQRKYGLDKEKNRERPREMIELRIFLV